MAPKNATVAFALCAIMLVKLTQSHLIFTLNLCRVRITPKGYMQNKFFEMLQLFGTEMNFFFDFRSLSHWSRWPSTSWDSSEEIDFPMTSWSQPRWRTADTNELAPTTTSHDLYLCPTYVWRHATDNFVIMVHQWRHKIRKMFYYKLKAELLLNYVAF